MFKLTFLLFTFAFLLFVSCNSNNNSATESKPKQTVPTADLIKQADDFYAQRNEAGNLRKAVEAITRAKNADSKNFEVQWKFAKYNFFLSKQLEDEKEIDEMLKDGYDAGIYASKMEPSKPDGFFWAAANLGERSKRSPITVGIKSTTEIRELMNKVIEIQPNYQGASAFDVLALVELGSRLTGGKPEKAVEYLQKALEYEKENGYIYLHLAQAYLATKNKPEAKKNLDYIFKMKDNPAFALERKEVEAEAKKLLDSNF